MRFLSITEIAAFKKLKHIQNHTKNSDQIVQIVHFVVPLKIHAICKQYWTSGIYLRVNRKNFPVLNAFCDQFSTINISKMPNYTKKTFKTSLDPYVRTTNFPFQCKRPSPKHF